MAETHGVEFVKPEVSKIIVRLTINNFSKYNGEYKSSSEVSLGEGHPKFWIETYKYSDIIGFFVTTDTDVTCYQFYRLYANAKMVSEESDKWLKNEKDQPCYKDFCFKTKITDDPAFISNGDQVSFVCVNYYLSPKTDWIEDYSNLNFLIRDLTENKNKVSSKIGKLHKEDYHSVNNLDIVIELEGNRNIKVHKYVLCSATEYFKAMFERSDSIEAKTGTIKIVDFNYETIKAVVDWIYLDQKVEDNVVDVFRAADKYQLPQLKSQCEAQLIQNLTSENILDTVVIADKYSATKLKALVIDTIIKNRKLLFKTDVDVKKALAVDYDLICSVMAKIAMSD